MVRYISRLTRVRGFLFTVALVERFALLLMVPLTLLWGQAHPGWLLAALFGVITVHAGAMGLNQPAYWVVVGKSVPAAWRGRLFGYAGGVAGVLGLGMDSLLRRLLSGPDGGFPGGYADCFLIAFLLMTVSVLPFAVIREPRGLPPRADDPHTGHYGQDSLRVWRTNAGFRRFLYGQIALHCLRSPFRSMCCMRSDIYGPARTPWQGTPRRWYWSTAFGGLGWGAWSDRAGNKIVLLGACACAGWPLCLRCSRRPPCSFSASSCCWRWPLAGTGIAGNNIVMEYAGPREIPLYTAMFNAITALPRAAAPLIGGLIADHFGGYQTLFILAATLGLLALLLTLRAGEPRHSRPVYNS